MSDTILRPYESCLQRTVDSSPQPSSYKKYDTNYITYYSYPYASNSFSYSFYPKYFINIQTGHSSPESIRAENAARAARTAILFGGTFLIGCALLAGSTVRNTIIAFRNYTQSNSCLEKASHTYYDHDLRPSKELSRHELLKLKKVIDILSIQQGIDHSILAVNLAYLASLTAGTASGLILLIGGLASASLLIGTGTLFSVLSISLAVFTWSFDQSNSRSIEQEKISKQAYAILHPWSSRFSLR